MSPIDLIRNFVFEHFEGEQEQRRVYSALWLPMERACLQAANTAAAAPVDVSTACEAAFAAALRNLRKRRSDPSGMEIYSEFQAWWESNAAARPKARLSGFAAAVAQVCPGTKAARRGSRR